MEGNYEILGPRAEISYGKVFSCLVSAPRLS